MYSAWAYGWMSQLFKALCTQHARTHKHTHTRARIRAKSLEGEIKDDESKWKEKKDEKSTNAVVSVRGKWDMKVDVFLT